jgi:hypothetical protein
VLTIVRDAGLVACRMLRTPWFIVRAILALCDAVGDGVGFQVGLVHWKRKGSPSDRRIGIRRENFERMV